MDKKSISITISDINDLPLVLKSLNKLFMVLLFNLSEKETDESEQFILAMGNYFGRLLWIIGYKPEDFEEKEK
jgi:hypothetical protein